MATKCATEVTILDQNDATAVRCWYTMSASATLPVKPTTTDASATPSGWSKTEPTISSDEDAAKYVYSCWQTVWGDGTCDWGDVSMSASFEAAKRAWNLAHSTKETLETDFTRTDDLIRLYATKTEAQQMAQPNLAPFFSMPIEDIYNASTNPDGYWKADRRSDTTQLTDGWAHIERSNTGTSTALPTFYEAAVWRNAHGGLKPSEIYTVLVEIRNAVITGDVTISGVTAHASIDRSMFLHSSESVPVADGAYHVTADTKDDTTDSNITTTTRSLITMPAGSSISCDIRLSLYEGTYTGPYKPYVSDGLYATQTQASEFRQTAEGISTEVGKISSAKYVVAQAEGWSLANLRTYAAEGHQENWNVVSTEGLRVGDTVYIKGMDSTRQCPVYVKVTATVIRSGTYFTGISHGYEDVLPVDTIKSTINQSSDSVKIKANHVEIDGTAIFSDTQFQAKLTETLDAIEVGGRNYLRESATLTDTTYWTRSNISSIVSGKADPDGGTNAYLVTPTNASWFLSCRANMLRDVGETYTCSIWLRADTETTCNICVRYLKSDYSDSNNTTRMTVTVPTTWTRFSVTGVLSQSQSNDIMWIGQKTATPIYAYHPKLERGTKPTDWSPAPEDQTAYTDAAEGRVQANLDAIEVGGRNLLRGTGGVTASEVTLTRASVPEPGIVRLTPTTSTALSKFKVDYLDYAEYGSGTYTASCDVRLADVESEYTSVEFRLYFGFSLASRTSSGFSSSYDRYGSKTVTDISGKWTRVTVTFDVPTGLTGGQTSALVAGSNLTVQAYAAASCVPVEVRRVKLENGNKPTPWTPAPEDVVSRTQRIYYRTQSNVAPATPGNTSSAWVTNTNPSRAVDNLTMANWTTKATSITGDSGANPTKYLYLWTCEQREMADGTLAYTNVLLDDSTTVIDGGTIITNSIQANAIKADSGTFNKANIPKLDADHINVDTISIGDLNGASTVINNAANGNTALERLGSTLGALTKQWSNVATYQVTELCRSTIGCNLSTSSGSIHISGTIGGYTQDTQGYVDVTIGCRGTPPYATVGQKDSTIHTGCCNIVAYYDSSYIVHVYAIHSESSTYKWAMFNLSFDSARQFELVDESGTTAPTGTKFFDLSEAKTEDAAKADAAAKIATNFITAISGKGIWVTPSDKKPNASGDVVSGTTSGWHIADALELFRAGVSMFKVWVDETTSAVMTRIGASSMGHLLLEQSAVKLCDALDWVAKFSLSTNENGGEPIHTAALEINDGTEQGMHIGLNINHNAATKKYSVYMGTRTSGVGYSNGADGGASILAPNVLLGTDATDTVTSVSMANFIHAFGTTLFTGNYSTTHASAVTLSETAANFSMLRIVYEDSDGYQGSVDVYNPDGKKFSATTTTATQTRLYIKSKSYQISGTTINCVYVNNSYYRHAQMELGSGVTTFATSELIGIVRVIGFY